MKLLVAQITTSFMISTTRTSRTFNSFQSLLRTTTSIPVTTTTRHSGSVLAMSTNSLYTACTKCRGEGKLRKPLSKKARFQAKRAKTDVVSPPPTMVPCTVCSGSGLVEGVPSPPTGPHIAIIGGGLGGLALAVACQHRSIPFTVYERDENFFERSQGYGLTMQQASKAFKSLGITLKEGITSTQHLVHTPDGTVVGSWGLRKWGRPDDKKEAKRQNIHIARQSLRWQLLEAMGGQVEWNCQLVGLQDGGERVNLTLQRGSETLERSANLVVGADGIRSTTRRLYLGEEKTPLRYLGCLVVLGIVSISDISSSSALLDGATVFQTADGITRIYAMPYSSDQFMWQLSFPLKEQHAKDVSLGGPALLKAEALKRCRSWHDPIPQLLQATPESLISGYPVYDRSILIPDMLNPKSLITLLGDSAHPMSPFKGQGANCAILDGLDLARAIYKEPGNLQRAVRAYESAMLARSTVKVQASAEAAEFLHSEIATQVGDVTRGCAAQVNLTKSVPETNSISQQTKS